MKFRISQSHDPIKNRPIFCVLGTDNGYRGGWHGTKHAACRELEALGEEEETPTYGWSREDTALWGGAVTCPTDDPEMMGCGAVVTGPPDWEGFYDCPNCGLFFKPTA